MKPIENATSNSNTQYEIFYNITHAGDPDGAGCTALLTSCVTSVHPGDGITRITIFDPIDNGDLNMTAAISRFVSFITRARQPINVEFLNVLTHSFGGCVELSRLSDVLGILGNCSITIKYVHLYITDLQVQDSQTNPLKSLADQLRTSNAPCFMGVTLIDHHKTNPNEGTCMIPDKKEYPANTTIVCMSSSSFDGLGYKFGNGERKRSAVYLLYRVLRDTVLTLPSKYTSDEHCHFLDVLERFAFEISEGDTFAFKEPYFSFPSNQEEIMYPDANSVFFKAYGFSEWLTTVSSMLSYPMMDIDISENCDLNVGDYDFYDMRYGVPFCTSETNNITLDVLYNLREREYDNAIMKISPIDITSKDSTVTYRGGLLFNCEASYIGNRILEENKEYDIIVIVYMNDMVVSMRSISDDVDVSEIAQKFGGGGHARAAGFKDLDKNIKLFTDIIIDKKLVF